MLFQWDLSLRYYCKSLTPILNNGNLPMKMLFKKDVNLCHELQISITLGWKILLGKPAQQFLVCSYSYCLVSLFLWLILIKKMESLFICSFLCLMSLTGEAITLKVTSNSKIEYVTAGTRHNGPTWHFPIESYSKQILQCYSFVHFFASCP